VIYSNERGGKGQNDNVCDSVWWYVIALLRKKLGQSLVAAALGGYCKIQTFTTTTA